jgi:hypothetical protein
MTSQWSHQEPLKDSKGNTEITGQEGAVKVLRTLDEKAVFNTYQFRLTSSSNTFNTANPWQLDRIDFLKQTLGVGRGN